MPFPISTTSTACIQYLLWTSCTAHWIVRMHSRAQTLRGFRCLCWTIVASSGLYGCGAKDRAHCVRTWPAWMDPLWNIISTQLTRVRRTPEAVVLDAVSAHTQVTIRRLMGRPLPPGAPTTKPRPGQQWEVDVYGHHQQRTVIAHPRCPVCFGGKTNLASCEPNE